MMDAKTYRSHSVRIRKAFMGYFREQSPGNRTRRQRSGCSGLSSVQDSDKYHESIHGACRRDSNGGYRKKLRRAGEDLNLRALAIGHRFSVHNLEAELDAKAREEQLNDSLR